MPDSTVVLTALRDTLVAAGLVRRPGTTNSTLPPIHVEPSGGAPAPGGREAPEDHPTLVVTLRLSGEVAQGPTMALRRIIVVDLVYRSRTTAGLKAGRALDAAVRDALVERSDYGVGLTIGTTQPVQVLQATVFGGLGPVSDVEDVRTDRAAYALEVLAD